MDTPSLLIAALVVAPAVGLVGLVWLVMGRVEGDLRAFSRFEAMHFEIGPQAHRHSDSSDNTRWPVVG